MNYTNFWKKLDFIFWIVVLFAFSMLAGMTTILVEKPLTPRSDYILILVVGTLMTISLVGLMAFGVYRWLKNNNSDVALKRALQVYGFFVVAMLVYNSFGFKKALEQRDQFEYLEAFRPRFTELMIEKLESNYPQDEFVQKHLEEIANCSYGYFDMDKDLFQQLKTAKNKRKFILGSKYLEESSKTCIEIYKDDKPFDIFSN